MRCLGERVLGEHLFYGLTKGGPTSSTHAAKLASSDDYTSARNSHQSWGIPEEPCLATKILQRFTFIGF